MKKRKLKKNLKDGSKNLLSYINKDHNHCSWDYGFLLGTFEAKLHDMEDFFSKEENCHLQNWQKVHHQIKWTRAILNVALKEKFEFDECIKFNTKNLDDDLKKRFQRLNEDKDKITRENLWQSLVYDIYRDKALRLAMKLIGRHCNTWWD